MKKTVASIVFGIAFFVSVQAHAEWQQSQYASDYSRCTAVADEAASSGMDSWGGIVKGSDADWMRVFNQCMARQGHRDGLQATRDIS